MSDLFEFTVEWPSSTAKSVIITGDFDQWSKSLPLTRSSSTGTFTGTIKVPYGSPTRYKFIVDNEWAYRQDLPIERTSEGFVNNIYYVPLKDFLGPPNKPQNGTTGGFISELADTIAARNGTSSALEYVTSGLGKTIHNVVGVDPINNSQIAIPTPISAHPSSGLPTPGPKASESTSREELDPTVSSSQPSDSQASGPMVAPIVPIPIIPVYAKENCTIDPTKADDERTTPTFVGLPPPARQEESKARDETEKKEILLPQVPLITTSTPTPPEKPAVAGALQEVSAVESVPAEEKDDLTSPAAPPAIVTAEPIVEEKTTSPAKEETPNVTEEVQKADPVSTPPTDTTAKPANDITAPDATKEHTKSMSEGSATVKSSSRPTTPTHPSFTPAATTPASTVNKKSKGFPQLGRGSSKGSVDEFGVGKGNGTTGSKKKRHSSFFGKIKHIFHHHEKEEGSKEKGTHSE